MLLVLPFFVSPISIVDDLESVYVLNLKGELILELLYVNVASYYIYFYKS
jgi:hypothetical protein